MKTIEKILLPASLFIVLLYLNSFIFGYTDFCGVVAWFESIIIYPMILKTEL